MYKGISDFFCVITECVIFIHLQEDPTCWWSQDIICSGKKWKEGITQE